MRYYMWEIYYRIVLPCVLKGLISLPEGTSRSINTNGINETNKQTTFDLTSTTTSPNQQSLARTMSRLELLNGTIISRLTSHERIVNTTFYERNNSDGNPLLDLLTIPTKAMGFKDDNKSVISNRVIKPSMSDNKGVNSLNQTSLSGDHKQQSNILTEGQKTVISSSLGSTTTKSIGLLSTVLTPSIESISPLTLSTGKSLPTTRKPIYIRGHKLQAGKPKSRNLYPDYETFKSPASMISKHGYPTHHIKSPCWPNCGDELFDLGKVEDEEVDFDNSDSYNNNNETTPNRAKRKYHNKTENRKIYTHRVMSQDSSSNNKHTTRVYGWIIGAAMLSVGSLVSLTGGILLCFCGDKIKRRREERRRLEKYGEYERVESVSSLVSSVHPNDYGDDQLESVSMI